MDNNILAQMQNWKKQLVMDPILNSLFDRSLNVKDFLHTKILTLQHDQIVQIYSKLSSLKHALSKAVQKEIQSKHNVIEESFIQKWELTQKFDLKNQTQIKAILKNLQNFNKKYQTVQNKLNSYKNSLKIIQFGKALQKFKITAKMLKTLMKDYTKQSQDSKLNDALNTLKISKLLKELSDLCAKNDFTGINAYENQKSFINNTKAIIYAITQRQTNSLIQQLIQSFQESKDSKQTFRHELLINQIQSKLIILSLINKLKDFITNFFKGNLKEIADLLTKLFQSFLPMKDFKQSLQNIVALKIINNGKLMLLLQQILIKSRLSQILKSFNFPNLFQKYWEKLIQYFVDLIKWSLQQESRDKQKSQSFAFSYTKLKNSLIMKYPVLFSWISTICCILHIYILQNIKFKAYQFHLKKEKIILILVPLSKKYYQLIQKQFCEQKLSEDKGQCFEKISNKIKKGHYSQKYFETINQIVTNVKNSDILYNLTKILLQIIKKNQRCFFSVIKSLQQQKVKEIQTSFKTIIQKSLQIFDNPNFLKRLPTIESIIKTVTIFKQIKISIDQWENKQLQHQKQ